jgi:basic membrane lipoprotein Med (substrate-binding protein (PBP1-ABC) superfamily)
MGGEDFAWYLHHASGAMARLGTRTAGGRTYDLHQGDYIKVGMAYDVGGRGDQSFNDAAAAGLDKAAKELGCQASKEASAVQR